MSSTSTLSVNNILSFNGHGGKVNSGKNTFTLPENVYVLVPFGIGVDGIKKPDGSDKQKTDEKFKGLDVCYGFPPPEAKNGIEQSFEDIIYSKDGKLKLTFDSNVDAKWYLYKPGDDVPNVNYYPWKSDGDPAAAAAASCEVVSTKYDDFVKDLMNECLKGTSSNELNKKVCAYFVSDSTKTTKDGSGKTTSAVLKDSAGNYHLKLKICGDGKSPTTTLQELAENCHKLVEFSRNFVKSKKSSGETYENGYDDNNIFPKSGPTDPIILLPFVCNSCDDANKNMNLNHTNAGDTSVEPLSKIIAELSGGGGGGGVDSDEDVDSESPAESSDQVTSGKVAQFFMTYKPKVVKGQQEEPGLHSDQQAQKIVNVVKCLMTKGYKHIGLTYSANQGQTTQIFENYKKNDNDIFSSNDEKEISKTIFLSAANQGAVLDNLSKLTTDSDFKKAFRIIPFSTMASSGGTSDLVENSTGDNQQCIAAAEKFLKLEGSIILGWCNQDIKTKLTETNKNDFNKDYTNISNDFPFAIGGGIGNIKNLLPNLFRTYLGEYFKCLTSKWDENVQKIVNVCNPDPISVGSPVSPPKDASSKKTPPVEKKQFANVLTDLEGKLSKDSEDFSSLGLTLPNFLYPLNGSETDKKNLNSADPAIDIMIKEFETTTDEGDKDFYLGASKSIQAAYDLDVNLAGDDGNKKLRAKLLLNLRKNSLLLKVPARWDYATMTMGVEPEPVSTPEEDKKKYDELQQQCAALGQTGGAGYASEDAYRLAEQLIPLDEKIESDKLEKKNKFVEANKPTTTHNYNPVEIKYDGSKGGFTLVVIQNSLNCGRAALSNFFGNKDLLVKGDPSNTAKLFNLKERRPDSSIDMGSICNLNKTYYDIFNDKVGNKEEREKDEKNNECPDYEEYSYQVLLRVLNVLGYNAVDDYNFSYNSNTKYNGSSANNEENYINSIEQKINELKQTAKDKKYLGYLVNLGRGHWICYKRETLNTDKDSFFRINSIQQNNITNNNDPTTLDKLINYEINVTKAVKNLYVFPIYAQPTTNMDIFAKLARLYKTKVVEGGSTIDEIDIDSYANEIKKNQINNKWKLFYKEVTSELAKDSSFFVIDNQLRIMNYLSNLPSNRSTKNTQITIGLNDEYYLNDENGFYDKKNIYGSIQSKIISLDTIQKKQVIDIFIKNIKNNLNKLNFITATDCNLTNITYDEYSDLYQPDFSAKNRYYYSLTQTCDYKKSKTFNSDLDNKGYFESANTLLKEIDTLFKTSQFTGSSSSVGGSKPTHNTTITNHAASKSKHNSSFKASSSSKAKVKSRSHTQRVK
jgi:hypothetical protein